MKHFEINEIFEILENKKENLKELETHIKVCPECRENYEKVKEFLQATQVEIPYDIKIRVKNRILESVRKKRRLRLSVVPLLVVSLTVFVIAFIFLISQNKKEVVIISPEAQAVLTPEEVLFVFKIGSLKDRRIYLDDIDITDSLRSDGNIYYYLAEKLELNPGSHNLIILKNNKIEYSQKFYLTSFKYSIYMN